ncbi:MAG: GHKL domain-containing protein [Calditrichaeota bacterium]|nr:GHKL domain-containing protein [Calditrichota bacterium]
MKLRTKFISLITAIHVIMLIFSLQLLSLNKLLFLGSELLILFSIVLSVQLYNAFIRPINLISAGIESLKDKDFSMKFMPVGQNEMDQLLAVYNQMIDKMREERIRQEEQHFFLQRLIEASPTGIIVLDFDDQLAAMNPAAEKLLNNSFSQIKGLRLDAIQHPLIQDCLDLEEGQKRTISRNGIELFALQKSHFLDRGFNKQFILIEELTEEIRKIEKQAYEKVIRMMSHEINNSIGAVNSIMESFRQFTSSLKFDDQDEFNHALDVVTKRNNRLNHFMKNFSDVVRIPEPNKREINLVDLLKSIETLVHAELKKRQISWRFETDANQFLILLDPEQFEQVLLNVIKNAYEAIDQQGEITVILNSNQQQLTIRDSGPGIADEIKSQLFTPFYSSKKDGQGIGLTIIREILSNHGFKFSLSAVNGHTDFTIFLNLS